MCKLEVQFNRIFSKMHLQKPYSQHYRVKSSTFPCITNSKMSKKN